MLKWRAVITGVVGAVTVGIAVVASRSGSRGPGSGPEEKPYGALAPPPVQVEVPPATPAPRARPEPRLPSGVPEPGRSSPVARAARPSLDEPALMARLRKLAEDDPPVSLELARDGNARFPNSPDAPERAWIVVKSLVDMGRFDEARDEALRMLKSYPDSPRTRDVVHHVLDHP